MEYEFQHLGGQVNLRVPLRHNLLGRQILVTAASTALMISLLLPWVEIAIKTSPCCPNALTCFA